MKTQFKTIIIAAVSLAITSVLPAKSFRTVVIDPGHGGHDKGCLSGRVYEKHLSLDTAARLENALKGRGYRTVMTRRSDYFVSLPERVSITKKYKNAIFISVHYNYTLKSSVSGIETFYNTPQSHALASFVQTGVLRRVRANNRGAKFARYYVLRNNDCPAILVECGFVSHATTRNQMKSAWFRESIAQGIADGVDRYRKY